MLVVRQNLLILLGAVRQRSATGELVLRQDDGERRFRFLGGELVAPAQSPAEPGLQQALERPLLQWSWNAVPVANPELLPQDRSRFWRIVQECGRPEDFAESLESEPQWKWQGRPDLLDRLGDLPLTPSTAFAVSFFCADPIGFETFRFLSNLDRTEAGRLIAALWALGALTLAAGELPALAAAAPPPAPAPRAAALPLILPPTVSPFGPPKRSATRPIPMLQPPEISGMPEFLELEEAPEEKPAAAHRPTVQLDLPRAEPAPRPRSQEDPDPPLPSGPPPAQPSLPGSKVQIPLAAAAASIELASESRTGPAPPATEAQADQAKAVRLLAQARRQLKLGRSVEAVITLEQVAELHPDDATAYETWLLLGSLRMRNSAWSARAIHAFQSAALIRPKELEPLKALAEVFRRSGAKPEVEACLQRIKELESATDQAQPGRR